MMTVKTFNSEAFCGYTQKTTFFEDFSIADHFGVSAIRDTFKRAFKDWKTNTEYITELVMVLNWKIWEHYETNEVYAKVYNELWEKADAWCCENLKGDALAYFYRTTD